MPYIGTQPTKVVSRQSANVYRYEATAGQTAFTGADLDNNVLACNPADMIVHMNGLRLESTDYTATSTTVTLTTAATAGDEVTVTSFETFEVADTYTKTAADDRYVNASGDTMTGGLTIHTGTSDAANLLLGNTANNWSVKTGTTSNALSFVDNQFATRMTIDSAGRVTMPYQPAFWAYNVTGLSTQTSGTIIFPQTDVNIGNHYSTSTGRFTAPISGVYEFNIMVLHRMVNVGGSAEITLLLNGANVSSRGLAYSGGSSGQGDLHIPQHITYRRSLSAGDYVQPYIHAMGSGQDFYLHSRLSYFTGRLIG